ncbi:MAG: ABC transporter substrate-binding protein, partial [Actinomycetia bacterium]|nr:ABC transporter substrate-binding protein [Actinomycetes bacterium]
LDDTGTAQTTFSYTNVSPAAYKKAKETGRLVEGTSPCTYMFYTDMTKIKDIKIRQALGWAFPYQSFWKANGKIEGVTIVPSTTILPPGTAGRKEYQSLEGQDGRTTDPEKAKALLEEADAVGYEISWPYSRDDKQSVAGMKVIEQALEEAGFTPKPIASTTDAIRDVLSDYDNGANVQYQGWCSDWPTGSSWFPAQWDGRLVGVAGRPNVSNFKEPEMDKMQDNILSTMTGEEAAKAWGEFDEKMQTEYYPAVLVGYSGLALLHGSKIGGMVVDNVHGEPYYGNIYIKQ